MPSESFSVAIWSSFSIQRKSFSSSAILAGAAPGWRRVEPADELALVLGERLEQLRRDGQTVAAGERLDLAGVAERSAHDHRLDSVGLVVGVDRAHRLDAGIGLGRIGPAARLDVPVEDAPDEGRDEERLASAAAIAWASEKISVMLQSMPSACSRLAACAPSQVEASLIRMRSRLMPRSL